MFRKVVVLSVIFFSMIEHSFSDDASLFHATDAEPWTGNANEAVDSSQLVAPDFPDRLKNTPLPQLPADLPNPAEMQEQLQLLEDFLALPPEKLIKIRETIERIEAMSPEQKARILDSLKRMKGRVKS